MKSIEAAILFTFIVVCLVHTGYAIKCWHCRSDNDPKCADPFDNSSLAITDCSHLDDLSHMPGVRPSMCRKIRQKVGGVWRYYRSCAFLGEPGIGGDERFCLMRTGSYNIWVEYCTCNSKDGCNTSSLFSPSDLAITMTSSLALFVAWLLNF